jgi:pyridoxal phosphate enzyme (YggS family)
MDMEEGFKEVQDRVAMAAGRAGRQPEEITIVAVTKTWPAEIVVAAYKIGMRHFGENRAEELDEKRPLVESELGHNSGIHWHAIGPLQSRKTKFVAENAGTFHALDRLKIANRLSNHIMELGPDRENALRVFIEVNVSGESSKAGLDCNQWEDEGSQREKLLNLARKTAELPGLKPVGLMTMAPWQVKEDVIRRVFQRTRRLSEWLQDQLPDSEWTKLSMGMTDDYEIAIEEGATHIRVGRAIFGPRIFE